MPDKPLRGFWCPDYDHPGWGWVCYREGSSGPYVKRVYVPVRIDPDDGEFTTLPEPQPDEGYKEIALQD
jgi:hypothetical protein